MARFIFTFAFAALICGWQPADAQMKTTTGAILAQAGEETAPPDAQTPADGQEPEPGTSEPDDEPGDGSTAAPGPENEPGHAVRDAQAPATTEILRDLSLLPFPARRMHQLLVEAARSGDVEALRPYIGSGNDRTMLSFGSSEADPIEQLKSMSGDETGHEILAILLEILEAGFVHFDKGTENEVYVWPYFFGVPIEGLSPTQRVELYRILTHGDYEEMKEFGAYIFYRTGISPQGRWRFFVAGD